MQHIRDVQKKKEIEHNNAAHAFETLLRIVVSIITQLKEILSQGFYCNGRMGYFAL